MTVLPKQKLSIVDNSASTTVQQQQHQPPGEQIVAARSQSSVSLHNINDIVNLTCHSGPSRPAAKLTWMLNEARIPSNSKWLSLQQQVVSTGSSGAKTNEALSRHQLVESRLTLSFRLQPNHLLGNQTVGHSKQLLLIKLRCVAKFAVEFVSDASILASGGKTQTTRVHQRPAVPRQSDSSGAGSRPKRPEASTAQTVSPYRWPRPAQPGAAPSGAERRNSPLEANLADSRFSSVLADSEPETGSGRPHPSRQYTVLVWTNRQLRAQAEHIDQLLRSSHPNELESPIIVAKSLKFDEEDVDNDNDDESHLADNQESAESSLAEAHIKSGPLWPPDKGRLALADEDPAPAGAISAQPPTVNQDYELNDIVQFTCISRVSRPDSRDVRRSVRLKWFINDKEVSFAGPPQSSRVSRFAPTNRQPRIPRSPPTRSTPTTAPSFSTTNR